MTSFTKVFLAAGAAAVVGIVAIAGTSQAGRWGGGHHGGFGAMRMLKDYDTDGDGKLTQAEIDTARSERFAKYDTNGDGALSLQEFQGLFQEFMRPMMVRAYQRLDPDGDASVTAEEYDSAFADIVARMDRNGDGALSQDDMRRGHHRHWHKDGARDDDSEDDDDS
jgi:Ca2+-binding EF-hand superfamily protein